MGEEGGEGSVLGFMVGWVWLSVKGLMVYACGQW